MTPGIKTQHNFVLLQLNRIYHEDLWALTWDETFSNILHPSVCRIHIVWAKWCLWEGKRIIVHNIFNTRKGKKIIHHNIFTARKEVGARLYFHRRLCCDSVHGGGVVPARGAHTQGGIWGGSGPGSHPRRKLRGIRSRPTPKGEVEGDQVQAHTQGGS